MFWKRKEREKPFLSAAIYRLRMMKNSLSEVGLKHPGIEMIPATFLEVNGKPTQVEITSGNGLETIIFRTCLINADTEFGQDKEVRLILNIESACAEIKPVMQLRIHNYYGWKQVRLTVKKNEDEQLSYFANSNYCPKIDGVNALDIASQVIDWAVEQSRLVTYEEKPDSFLDSFIDQFPQFGIER